MQCHCRWDSHTNNTEVCHTVMSSVVVVVLLIVVVVLQVTLIVTILICHDDCTIPIMIQPATTNYGSRSASAMMNSDEFFHYHLRGMMRVEKYLQNIDFQPLVRIGRDQSMQKRYETTYWFLPIASGHNLKPPRRRRCHHDQFQRRAGRADGCGRRIASGGCCQHPCEDVTWSWWREGSHGSRQRPITPQAMMNEVAPPSHHCPGDASPFTE
jgi:hypothetical protein